MIDMQSVPPQWHYEQVREKCKRDEVGDKEVDTTGEVEFSGLIIYS